MNLYDELLSLVDALSSAQVEYAICGGLALAIHGHPRMTTDIDLLVREEDLLKILEIVKTCGFTLPSGRIPFHLAGQNSEDRLSRRPRHDEELDRVDGKLSGPGIPTASALSRARDQEAQPPLHPRADA